MNTGDATPATRTAAAILGRRADTTRRRERVLAALAEARSRGAEVTATGIAQQALIDRTFLYRHPDLLEQLPAAQTQPNDNTLGPDNTVGPAASVASLQADLLAAHEHAARLAAHNQHLERHLSQALGDQAWRESGLGAPHDRAHPEHHRARTTGRRPATRTRPEW
jgi:hypothetical protein